MRGKDPTHKRKHFFSRLNTKFIFGFCILAILISSSSCIIGYYEYKTNIEKLYNTNAYAVAYEARSLIDGEKIKQYSNTKKTDEDYKIMQNNIETLRKNMDVVSIFIVKLDEKEENTYNYILDTIEPPTETNEFRRQGRIPPAIQKRN